MTIAKTIRLRTLAGLVSVAGLVAACAVEPELGSSTAALTLAASPSNKAGGPFDTKKECDAARKAENKASCAASNCHTPCEKVCKNAGRELDGHKAGSCIGVADGEGGTKKAWSCSCDCGKKFAADVSTGDDDNVGHDDGGDPGSMDDPGYYEPGEDPAYDDPMHSGDEEFLPEDACDGTVEPLTWH